MIEFVDEEEKIHFVDIGIDSFNFEELQEEERQLAPLENEV